MSAARIALGSVLVALCLAASAGAWEIQLTAEEYKEVGGQRRITCGVPLLPGQAKDVKDLRVLSDGKPVPAQFRELARWWRADNSLRWVLVDLAADVKGLEKKAFVLTDAKVETPSPAAKLTVEQDDNFITVTTGPAKFVVSKKKFNFLEKACVDLNGDGKAADDENLLASTPECGTVTEDNQGLKYFGSEGVASVAVLEAGPMRVCVRAMGVQPPHEGKGYGPGLYGYDVFMNFYAGSTDVFADVILTNNATKSRGVPAMEDGSLVLKLAGGVSGCKLIGDKPVEAKLAGGESLCLYQDSNGADTWQKCSGFGKMKADGWDLLPDQFTTFRGFKVWKRAGKDKEEELGAGNTSRGTLQAWNDRGGVVVHMKNFWKQFPKASEAAGDGTVRVGLFPREWKWPHLIQDGAAKGHEIVLHFFGAKNPAGPYAKDAAGRPDAGAIGDIWDSRVMLRTTLAHMAAAGALSDLGPYTPPTKGLDSGPGNRTSADDKRMLEEDKLYGNAYGWRIYGDRWRSNGGHGSLGARQPIDEDNYLYRWYVTGHKGWFAAGDARSRHWRDVRRYRIDGVDPMSYKDWGEFRKNNISERDEWTSRPQPADEEIKKYMQGLPGYASSWSFPNPEHCTLDLNYDRYLLFGDQRAFENMRYNAAFGAFFSRDNAPKPGSDIKGIGPCIGRDRGWSWRTIERYWELTGDKRADELLKGIIKAYEPLIGKTELWFASPEYQRTWFTQIFSRAAAMTALHTGDPQALEIVKALASDKGEKPVDFATILAVTYHLTGDQKYKDWLAKPLEGDALLGVGGYYPASAHWLAKQPPKGK
ncbi:MAG TPA: hypothetical protein PK280_04470 [Planctomycetota bacterium]|nr:hypothetical protein [Planctomycetota bacterium]